MSQALDSGLSNPAALYDLGDPVSAFEGGQQQPGDVEEGGRAGRSVGTEMRAARYSGSANVLLGAVRQPAVLPREDRLQCDSLLGD
jgi:hypothetical protein